MSKQPATSFFKRFVAFLHILFAGQCQDPFLTLCCKIEAYKAFFTIISHPGREFKASQRGIFPWSTIEGGV